MKEHPGKNINRIILGTMLCGLAVYLVLRAFYMSFTFDECVALEMIRDSSILRTPNDHYIPAWLMTFFYHIFGPQEIWLRMPNVLAFLIYAYFAYRILIRAKNVFLMLAGAAFLLLNPYLLEFFSLARGYGLSLGFALGALFFFLGREDCGSYRQFFSRFALSMLLSLLAAYSNLINVNLNIALMLLFIIDLILLAKNNTITLNRKRILSLLGILFINLIMVAFLALQLFKMQARHELYFGGGDFLDDTISPLIICSVYKSYYGETFWIATRIAVIVLFGASVIFNFINRKYNSFARITLLLFMMVMAAVLQHCLFATPYPMERTALIFIPLYALLIFFLLSEIHRVMPPAKYAGYIFGILVVAFLFLLPALHFAKNISLIYTREWTYDMNTKWMMRKIRREYKKGTFNKSLITISYPWYYRPSIRYYHDLYHMDYLLPVMNDEIDRASDLIYCSKLDMERLGLDYGNAIISEYESTGTVLIKTSNHP